MDFQRAIQNGKMLTREAIQSRVLIFLESLSNDFVEWNRERLRSSTDIDGEAPLGVYSPATESLARSVNRPRSGTSKIAGQPYNMEWHGSLFKSIYTEIEQGISPGLLAKSSEKDQGADKWDGLLTHIYNYSGEDKSEKLIGFTDEEINNVRTMLQPVLTRFIRDTLTR